MFLIFSLLRIFFAVLIYNRENPMIIYPNSLFSFSIFIVNLQKISRFYTLRNWEENNF